MCLISPKKFEAKAWKSVDGKMAPMWYDTTCYKVMRVRPGWPFINNIYSPIRWMRWNKFKTYSTGFDEPEIINGVVDGRCYYSFMNKEDAIALCNYMNGCATSGCHVYRVYECTIPANTNFIYEGYYEMPNGGLSPCFASEKMKIRKCVYK